MTGFLIVEVFDGSVTTTTFFDAEGNPVRAQVTAFFQGTLTNPATGETIRGQQELVIFRDFDQATERTWAGLRFRAVFPGAGALLLDAGRLVFDVGTGEVFFEAGPHQVFHEDFDAYCAAFAHREHKAELVRQLRRRPPTCTRPAGEVHR